MATSVASPASAGQAQSEQYIQERGFAVALVTVLTLTALLVHGYHPYAEDGGVYVPEIKRLLNPALYPQGAEFVVGHLRYSLFAPMIAWLVRASSISLDTILFAVYLASFWMVLYAGWMLAVRCFESREARCGAVGLLAVWLTLPIAGTSLMLMDPYVTARSLSTPCALLALAGALDWRVRSKTWGFAAGAEQRRQRRPGWVLCFAALVVAVAMHPLMGALAVAAVLLLAAVTSPIRAIRVWGTAGLVFAAFGVAAVCLLAAPVEDAAYRLVVATRPYWFLSRWNWYEQAGIFAPLLILASAGARRGLAATQQARVSLCRMAFFAGVAATVVVAIFARPAMQTHLVARLQPLRIFQLVYVVMILVLGGALGQRVLQRKPWRWMAVFGILGSVMLWTGRATFPASSHVEWPEAWTRGAAGRLSETQPNPWEQAFVWIRENTPVDAVFALDARYITEPGEDAQGFRAIAERSALPDYSKDGGVVTNKPELAARWMQGQKIQQDLSEQTDAQRIAALLPLGVQWVVLQRDAGTRFNCVYANRAVKVCRLP